MEATPHFIRFQNENKGTKVTTSQTFSPNTLEVLPICKRQDLFSQLEDPICQTEMWIVVARPLSCFLYVSS